ncbi:Contactin-4 [Acipenser ruthenus]|uniref:Contactin-4 n=1 Tax=Acipenser ruthenus TaxID=7906 RepID=A0A444UTF7_ACIRT|nr:Contactin-4 [Acipenser ruthenus]
MEIIVGESVVLPCQISCDPALDVSFTWSFNEQLIDFKKDGTHFEKVGGAVTVDEITETTAQLSWKPGSDNASPLTGYSIQGSTPYTVGWLAVDTVPEVIDGNTLTATIVDLNPWVEYEFRVVASNSVGVGEPSAASLKTRTEEAEPNKAPDRISAKGVSASEIEVSWQPVSSKETTGRVLGYEVSHWEDDTKPEATGTIRLTGNETSLNITGLKGNTLYYIAVSAFNTAGTGPSTDSVNATTKKPPPSQPPENIEWSFINSKLILKWDHVIAMENESEVTGYEVVCRRYRHNNDVTAVKTNRTAVELQLSSSDDYIIEVKTLSDGGDGVSSGQIRIQTLSKSFYMVYHPRLI